MTHDGVAVCRTDPPLRGFGGNPDGLRLKSEEGKPGCPFPRYTPVVRWVLLTWHTNLHVTGGGERVADGAGHAVLGV